jgi:tRNA(His) guanylyltransferase
MKNASLSDRMKRYEDVSRIYLTRRSPLIIRIDGKAFHTFTKGLKKPFDDILMYVMQETAKYLCKNISGVKVAYVQSDEISLLVTDYDTLETQAWFDNNLQKIVSVSASIATLAFNKLWKDVVDGEINAAGADFSPLTLAESNYLETIAEKNFKAMFDSRAFILPKEEVCNYFIWRQQDAIRNSINSLAQTVFTYKQLEGLNTEEMQIKLALEKNIKWNALPTDCRNGACVYYQRKPISIDNKEIKVEEFGWVVDKNIPLFTKDRDYIERFVFCSGRVT